MRCFSVDIFHVQNILKCQLFENGWSFIRIYLYTLRMLKFAIYVIKNNACTCILWDKYYEAKHDRDNNNSFCIVAAVETTFYGMYMRCGIQQMLHCGRVLLESLFYPRKKAWYSREYWLVFCIASVTSEVKIWKICHNYNLYQCAKNVHQYAKVFRCETWL